MTDAKQQDSPTRAAAPGGNGVAAVLAPCEASPLGIAARSPEFLCNAVALTGAGAMFLSLPRWYGMKRNSSRSFGV